MSDEERIDAIVDQIASIALGDFSVRGELSPGRDALDGVVAGLNMLVEHFEYEHLQRRRAEAGLQDALEVYDTAPGLFCTVSADDHRIVRCNRTLADALGRDPESLVGTRVTDLCGESAPRLRRILTDIVSGKQDTWPDVELERAGGKSLVVSTSASLVPGEDGRPQAIRVIWRDVTEERRLEGALMQAQKMESVGRLAGGIAHDFNNLITIIQGYAAYAMEHPDVPRPVTEELEQIQVAARRAADLTRQLLAFSRRSVVQPRSLDIGVLVAEMQPMLDRVLGDDIELSVTCEDGLWTTRADPGQIEQVVMNLAVNARDAMPNGGTLTLEVSNVELDDTYAREHLGVEPGPHVMLVISDTGIGMEAAVLSQVFDPFFTTKQVGQGTGLGLSMCYGIVRQAGGQIWVYSEPGQGATFKIYLPRSEPSGKFDALRPAAEPKPGQERVLVVEDDEMVRRLTVRVLTRSGYQVESAASGEEALEIAATSPGAFDLLVTDVTMPGMSGPDLVARMADRGAPRVLFLSGYTEQAISRHGVKVDGRHFLPKPFTARTLLEKVREVLDE